MVAERGGWRNGEVLAYSERDGPGRPPGASSVWLMGTLTGVVGVTFVGFLWGDTLCPDHRAWVEMLAAIGVVSIVGALVGLVRGWASAPLLTLFAGSLGLSIGLIDAVHAPTRGRLLALGFGVALVLAAVASVRVIRLRRWDRSTDEQTSLGDLPPELRVASTDESGQALQDRRATVSRR